MEACFRVLYGQEEVLVSGIDDSGCLVMCGGVKARDGQTEQDGVTTMGVYGEDSEVQGVESKTEEEEEEYGCLWESW
ncbi:hypothetical protein E2C01_080429 [Portunus trituberculatus]|uniref:Uncharacterized protein n=1 Tax=Portunus trituberculatus TaxID=210409 RepID=A0A5B7IW40_PORTR|nr:hypothetical protein [Portunus trituberculatus]